MAIYINSNTLKLEKKLKSILEILFFLSVYIEHVKFQEASFNSNWDIKRKSFGSIPSPHPLDATEKKNGNLYKINNFKVRKS